MIIERTSYPWTPYGVLFRQRFAVGDRLAIDLQVDTLPYNRNGLVVREIVDGNLKSIQYYRYNAFFSYIQAVKQVLLTDYYISVDWFGKFKVVDEDGNVVNYSTPRGL